jgi:hypothetical protein
MTDKQEYRCTMCGHDAGSKFALKRHKSLCGSFPVIGGHADSPDPRADRYLLATRDTKYHRFVKE